MEEFYKEIITDLRNQVAVLADQKATQVGLNAMRQKDIDFLSSRVQELEAKVKELEDKYEPKKAPKEHKHEGKKSEKEKDGGKK